jgi:hypothetical protein
MPLAMQGAPAEYARQLYKGELEIVKDIQAIGNSAERVLKADGERVFTYLVNLGNDTIFVGFDNVVSSSRGMYLAANGGYISFNAFEDMMLPTEELWAVSVGTSTNIYFYTMRRFAEQK